MDTMEKVLNLPPVTGKQHNSLGLSLFSPRMLLGASLVQQKDRLKDRRERTEYELIRITLFVLLHHF